MELNDAMVFEAFQKASESYMKSPTVSNDIKEHILSLVASWGDTPTPQKEQYLRGLYIAERSEAIRKAIMQALNQIAGTYVSTDSRQTA